MKSRLQLTRTEKRAHKKLKKKLAPKGAKFSGQIKKVETSKKYAGKKKK